MLQHGNPASHAPACYFKDIINNSVFSLLKGKILDYIVMSATIKALSPIFPALKGDIVEKKLADIIRFHRKLSGLTQLELAEMADVGKNLVYEVEKGKLSIRFDNLLKILQVLNIDVSLQSPLYEGFLKEYPDDAAS